MVFQEIKGESEEIKDMLKGEIEDFLQDKDSELNELLLSQEDKDLIRSCFNVVKKYENIKYALDSNTPLELILYNNGKDDVQFVSELFKYYTKKDIDNVKLKIHSFNDVEITSKEIIDTINLKPGPWIKDIISQIEKNILLNKLNNRKEEIVDFLLKIK